MIGAALWLLPFTLTRAALLLGWGGWSFPGEASAVMGAFASLVLLVLLPPLELRKMRDGSWWLQAEVPSGLFNRDRFLYKASQDYSGHDLGYRVQRLGDWAYLYE